LRYWVGVAKTPANAINRTTKEARQKGEFTAFLMPVEVVPHTMTVRMQGFDWNGNPVSDHFTSISPNSRNR
jgi:hypothetical protein